MRAFSRCSGAISRGGHEWVVLRNGTRGCNTPGLCHVATTRHSCYNTQPQAAAAAAPEAALASTAAGHADDADEEASGSGIKKRVCALHLGYIGTGFKGSQVNRALPASETVEGTLESALHAAGFIADTNMGDFDRIRWSRSSRTDKGVHSLSLVCSMKLLVDESLFDSDPEGTAIATAVNAKLPPAVRVFSAQRVNKKFNTRRWCRARTYEYFLPASVLGLALDGSEADAAKVAALDAALQKFVGRKPYHNFAGRAAQYRPDVIAKKKGKKSRRRGDDDDDDELESEEEESADEGPETAGTVASSSVVASSSAAHAQAGSGAAQPALAPFVINGEQKQAWPQVVRFVEYSPDNPDVVATAHFRIIHSWTVSGPTTLVPGGVPCLKLEVRGESFILHQIRHMVGAAVAVARGVLSLDALDAALHVPVRMTTPRAPAHGLLLADSEFGDFVGPKDSPDGAVVCKWSGKALALRTAGQANRQAFRREFLDSTMNEALQHPDWAYWSDNLQRYVYPQQDVAQVVERLVDWRQERAAAAAAAAAAWAARDKSEGKGQRSERGGRGGKGGNKRQGPPSAAAGASSSGAGAAEAAGSDAARQVNVVNTGRDAAVAATLGSVATAVVLFVGRALRLAAAAGGG